jgi:hypothetical protein
MSAADEPPDLIALGGFVRAERGSLQLALLHRA